MRFSFEFAFVSRGLPLTLVSRRDLVDNVFSNNKLMSTDPGVCFSITQFRGLPSSFFIIEESFGQDPGRTEVLL